MPASEQKADPNGRYTLIPRVLCFITLADKVLLLKGAAHKRIWAGLYNGVGGHVEADEDILSAAQREVVEETGLRGLDWQLRGVVNINAGATVGIGMYVFVAESPTQVVHDSAEGTLEWVAQADLARYPLVEDLPIILPKALEAREPFFAYYSYDSAQRLHIRFASS